MHAEFFPSGTSFLIEYAAVRRLVKRMTLRDALAAKRMHSQEDEITQFG